jgi:hypothetical protein
MYAQEMPCIALPGFAALKRAEMFDKVIDLNER